MDHLIRTHAMTNQTKANELRRAAQRAARAANPWMPINPFDSKEEQAAQLAARAAIAERPCALCGRLKPTKGNACCLAAGQ
jgi:hypothetical protein